MAASIQILKSSDDVEDGDSAIESKQDICCICVEQSARYTCPRCNVRYCSLACYKDKKHEDCSESFYRDCVMEEMKDQTARPEDRQKVLEMLSREHEQLTTDLDEADDTPSLAERIEGLNLDTDGAQIWKRLTAAEREEFAYMMKDGRLANLVTIWTPWWIAKLPSGLVQDATDTAKVPEGFPDHLTDIPDINHLLKGKPSADIKYNVVNVVSAYAFVTRLHNGDHHDHPLECAEELLKVCGVLGDNVNYSGSKESVHAVIQEVQKKGSGFVVPPSFPVVLVADVVRILQGNKLWPVCWLLSALSDTLTLLKQSLRDARKDGKRGKKKKGKDNVSRPEGEDDQDVDRLLFLGKKKVVFLISWAQRYGMGLASVCAELSLELECLKEEEEETRNLQTAVEENLQAGKLQPRKSKVEEIKSVET